MRRASVLFLGLAVLGGCPDRTVAELSPTPEKVETKDIPINIERDIDILFVIDKSPTMADEQAGLTANFPRFMQLLSQVEGGLPSVHIGVISQDIGAGGLTVGGNCSGVGDDGKLLATPRIPGCTPPTGNFISDLEDGSSGGRIKNYTGSLEDTFSCIATLGPSGCGFEQHLGSLERAIENPLNASFFRKDAFLAVIFISDEDDCTASNPRVYDPNPSFTGELGPLADFRCFEWGWECDQGTLSRTAAGTYSNCRPRTNSPYLRHPDELVGILKGLKDDPEKIIVATLMGPMPAPPDAVRVSINSNGVAVVAPSCTNGGQNAFPMPRLLHFANAFPDRNTFYSLCNNDLSAGLTLVAQLIRRAFGNFCFESNVDQTDLDPAQPGLQLQCAVSDVTNPGKANAAETAIPACRMANDTTPDPSSAQPCWYVVPDPAKCDSYPTQLALAIHPPDRVTPTNTHVIAQCVTD